jgi:hypothetical protein
VCARYLLVLAFFNDLLTSAVVIVKFRVLFIALTMEAVRISETSFNFNVTTRPCIPEDLKLHARLLVVVSVLVTGPKVAGSNPAKAMDF